LSIGGYDEPFLRNEDVEFDVRVGKANGVIWLETGAVTYFPRATTRALARQYFLHGRGRAMTFSKHRPTLKLRQFMPLLILYGCLAGEILSFVNRCFW
jgi:succinoglycan biosynthesis protein ExoA